MNLKKRNKKAEDFDANIYSPEYIGELLDSDEITPEEAAFMLGFLTAG